MTSPFGQSRGGTPADERARKARAASDGAAVVDAQRLPAFRFLIAKVAKGSRDRAPRSSGAELDRTDLTARARKSRCGNGGARMLSVILRWPRSGPRRMSG